LLGGGHTAPDQAAFYNSALVRYLDFNDSYLAKGETCHPSDAFGPVFALMPSRAVRELTDLNGRTLGDYESCVFLL
jgi:2-methylcitrate dehydratase